MKEPARGVNAFTNLSLRSGDTSNFILKKKIFDVVVLAEI
jgi:hypothetical protein